MLLALHLRAAALICRSPGHSNSRIFRCGWIPPRLMSSRRVLQANP